MNNERTSYLGSVINRICICDFVNLNAEGLFSVKTFGFISPKEAKLRSGGRLSNLFTVESGFIFFIIACFTGCDIFEPVPEKYNEMVVVEAYAVADQALPVVFITTTVPADSGYTFPDAAVDNADVQVVLMDDQNEDEDEDVFLYASSESSPGLYEPQDLAHTVLPGRTYRLNVTFNSRPEKIQAYTTIPDAFSILNEVRDTITYQSEEQLELVVQASQNQPAQNVFAINTIAQVPEPENLTPFYLNLIDETDSEAEDFIMNSSGLINEANFDVNPDGTVTLFIPWITVAFFEDNIVIVNSVDKNLSDLIRSQNVQLGGSTLPPGEIPNVRYNIEGGIGIFGSIASDTAKTYFKRPDE